ncbi:AraC family transcriptional regulator ligand-binding domain-containing protein [Nocardia sp. NPDC101769]|uniref:AraC family transcriptional regulator ligand-binding domain-containing protein n=1 Tax=Nocardia sp. NPDC101769 TaxID=3364333 RepID=UPI003824DCC9
MISPPDTSHNIPTGPLAARDRVGGIADAVAERDRGDRPVGGIGEDQLISGGFQGSAADGQQRGIALTRDFVMDVGIFGLANLGPVALVAREEPDIRSALQIVLRYIALHNEALRTGLTQADSLTTIHIQAAPGASLGRQATELAVGATCRILRELLGQDWHPLSVCFTHGAPERRGNAHRILGPTIEFEQSFNGIVCYTHELDAANPLADPLLRPCAREYLRSLTPVGESTAEQARAIIETLLPTHRCSAATVATRLDLAHRYLTHHHRTLTAIATELGFSELSAFSRWFRHHTGHSPTDVRTPRLQKDAAPPSGSHR